MASIVNYVADGATNQFQIPFTYINQSDVVVTVNGTTPTFTFVNSTTINIASTPASGAKVIVKRVTPVTALVDFTDGSTLFEADLDLAHLQNRLIAEESRERADSAIETLNANITNIDTVAGIAANVTTVAGNTTNVNSVATNMAEVLLADTNAATATTKATEASASASTASAQATISTTKAGESSTSAAEALASKNAALTSENNASTSESNASASKVIATTKAGEALTSETNAASSANSAATSATLATTQANLATTNGATQVSLATVQAGIATTKANEAAASATNIGNAETSVVASAVAAANSAAAAATALDSFDDRYLGVKSSDPTVDNDGNSLAQGALYFSSSSSSMQVYDGANWIAASSSGVSSLTLFEYTATAGQTAFTGSDDNGLSMSFIAANLLVTMNGVILDPSDFTTSGGVTVTLGSGAAVGDIVNIYAFKSFQVSDTVSASTGGTFAGAVSFSNGATVSGTVAATAYTGDGSALTGVGSPSIDDNGNATAITITSDEDVLISTTNINPHSDGSGIALKESAGVLIGVDGTHAIIAARHNSDGEVIRIQKDNSTVGVIGTQGSRLSIGSGDVNLNFNASANSMYPISDPAAGTLSSGIVDLGAALATFKDAYLSGGVYLGGTGSANLLDSYEEGTFTPTFVSGFTGISYSQQHGFYTKVGNTVTIYYSLQLNNLTNTTSAQVQIGNLPFVTSTSGAVYQAASGYIATAAVGSANNTFFITFPNSTSMGMYLQNSNGVQGRTGSNVGSSFYTSGTVTYFTPA